MKKIDNILNNDTVLIDAGDITVITDKAKLNNCNIIFNAIADSFFLNQASIRNGTFHAKKVLEDFQLCKASFEHVEFLGSYSGCDFGKWVKNHGINGGVYKCDFSKSDYIHNCRFFNCENGAPLFPKWPHVTIRNSVNLKNEISNIIWPGKIGIMMNIITNIPEECTFVVINSSTLINKLGGSLSDLKKSFEQLSLAEY